MFTHHDIPGHLSDGKTSAKLRSESDPHRAPDPCFTRPAAFLAFFLGFGVPATEPAEADIALAILSILLEVWLILGCVGFGSIRGFEKAGKFNLLNKP